MPKTAQNAKNATQTSNTAPQDAQKSQLKLFNTLTRKVENFKPQNPEKVKIYTCGPTVYSTPHIGNFAAYIYWDLLIRTLKVNNLKPQRVLNFTDVGHLASDGDEGEDKLEKGARTSGKTVWEVAEKHIAEFRHDFGLLNLTPPNLEARATDYIKQGQELVNLLTEKGYTYKTRDGIYFDTAKFPKYADFARLDLENLKEGARIGVNPEKLSLTDFALWKFIQPGESHAMRWDYLDKPGYPGWHLECSSIIHAELGEPIDIHTGGIDHIPVHHSNEIAQTEAAFGTPLAKFWLHCNFLTVDGQKISKSLGNTITLAELAKKGFSPLDFKLWVLQGHYQSERDFTFANLEAARARRLNWRNQIAKCYQKAPENYSPGDIKIAKNAKNSPKMPDFSEKYSFHDINGVEKIRAALNDNLNSAQAFAEIDAVTDSTLDFWQVIDAWFGLGLIADSPHPSEEVQDLLKKRQAARAEKDYAESDRLRTEIEQHGFTVLDTPQGQIWQYLA